MKICLISDTHCQLNKIKLPKADLLIHAGDATYRGDEEQISEFNVHLAKYKDWYKKGIYYCPGNHDFLFERNPELALSLMTNAHVVINSKVVIKGLNFYFAPQTPRFHDWAFNVDRGEAIKKYWEAIPKSTNVLVTHGPPFGILDKAFSHGANLGCEELAKRVLELPDLKLHVFGHIHGGFGLVEQNGVKFVNASNCTEQYKPTNKPIIVQI